MNTVKIADYLNSDAPKDPAFVVVVMGATAPTVAHVGPSGRANAEAEAQRLIDRLPTTRPQSALVLRIESAFTRGAAIVPPITVARAFEAAPPGTLPPNDGGGVFLYRDPNLPPAQHSPNVFVARDGKIMGINIRDAAPTQPHSEVKP